MNNKTFLIIKTNQYTGNFERELMAYVFGYDKDGYADEELDIFRREVHNEELFYDFLDTCAFGEHDGEYSCYRIDSHPTNKVYFCDSFYICMQKKLSNDASDVFVKRLRNFCEYYNKTHDSDLRILDINYYQNKLFKIEDKSF